MKKYGYIPNEFGRIWVASRHEHSRGIYTPLVYIDINDGNRYDADVFAQIMYWHEPNKETGETRLKREHDGHLWLYKNHADWFQETRIKQRTVRQCLDRIRSRKLIIYELGGEKGNPTPRIRVNWDEFERRIRLWMEHEHGELTEKNYERSLSIYSDTPDISCHTLCHEMSDPLTSYDSPLTSDVISNTETTQRVSEDDIKKSFAAPAAPDSEIQNPEPAIPGAFEETIEMLDIPNAPKPPERVLVPVDDDWDKPPDLYDCTSQDIAAVLHAYYTWCPKDKLPTKRGKVVAFNKGVVNMPANREYAENQIRRGIVPSDYIEFLSNLGHFLKIESADRYARMANNLNVEEPLAFKWLKNLEKQRELPFCYLAPIVEEWVAAGRDWYTDECPRVLHRHPDVTPRITLGQDERENPDLVVDVPPPYISPHAAAGLIDDDDYEDDSESDDMDNWTPDDWAKAGMPL